MSMSLTPGGGWGIVRPRPLVHWICLLALLLAQLVLLGGAYHVGTLLGDGQWWQRLAGQGKLLSWLATATITGLLIFGTAQLSQARPSLVERLRHPRLS